MYNGLNNNLNIKKEITDTDNDTDFDENYKNSKSNGEKSTNISNRGKINKLKINVTKRKVIECDSDTEDCTKNNYESSLNSGNHRNRSLNKLKKVIKCESKDLNTVTNLSNSKAESSKINFCTKDIKVESYSSTDESFNKTKFKQGSKNQLKRKIVENPVNIINCQNTTKQPMVLISNNLNGSSGKIGKIKFSKNMEKILKKKVKCTKKYKFIKLPKNILVENPSFTVTNKQKPAIKTSLIKNGHNWSTKKCNFGKIPNVKLQNESKEIEIVIDKTTDTKKADSKFVYNVLSEPRNRSISKTKKKNGASNISKKKRPSSTNGNMLEEDIEIPEKKQKRRRKIKGIKNDPKNLEFPNDSPESTDQLGETELNESVPSNLEWIESNVQIESNFNPDTQLEDTMDFVKAQSPEKELDELLQMKTENNTTKFNENEVIVIDDDSNDESPNLLKNSFDVGLNTNEPPILYIMSDDLTRLIYDNPDLCAISDYDPEISNNTIIESTVLIEDNQNKDIFVECEEIVEAQINETNLNETNLNETNLNETNLTETNLNETNLNQSDETTSCLDKEDNSIKENNDCDSNNAATFNENVVILLDDNSRLSEDLENRYNSIQSPTNEPDSDEFYKYSKIFDSTKEIEIPGLSQDVDNNKASSIIEKKEENSKEKIVSSALFEIKPQSESAIEIDAALSFSSLRIYKVAIYDVPERELYKNINTENLPYPVSSDPRLVKQDIEETAIVLKNNDPRIQTSNLCLLNSNSNIMNILDKYLQRSKWYQAKNLLQKDEINLILSELVNEIMSFREIKAKHLKIELEKNVHDILNKIGLDIDSSGCLKEQFLPADSNEIPGLNESTNKVIEVYRYNFYNPAGGFFPQNCQPQQFPAIENNFPFQGSSNFSNYSSLNMNHNESRSQNNGFNNDTYENSDNQSPYRNRNPFNNSNKNHFKNSDNNKPSYSSDTHQKRDNQFNYRPRNFNNSSSEGAGGYKEHRKKWGGGFKNRDEGQENSNETNDFTYEPLTRPSANQNSENNIRANSNFNESLSTSYRDLDSEKEQNKNDEEVHLVNNNKSTNSVDPPNAECSRASTPDWDE